MSVSKDHLNSPSLLAKASRRQLLAFYLGHYQFPDRQPLDIPCHTEQLIQPRLHVFSQRFLRTSYSQRWHNCNHMPPVRLEVYIQPRASTTEFAGMHDGAIKIRIAAPAVENAANRALIDFIAQHLGIAKRCVRVVSGHTSRKKILEIDGVTADLIAASIGSTSFAQP